MRPHILLFCAAALFIFSCSKNNSDPENFNFKSPNLSSQFNYEELKLPASANIPRQLTNGNFLPDNFFHSSFLGGIFNGNVQVNGSFRIHDGDMVINATDFQADPSLINNSLVNITNDGATLGRVLFYDKKLSLNNTISCGSCHHQDKAFTDGVAVSSGFEGRKTDRSSMAIINPVLQNNLFWDSRSSSIHDLSLKPVQNHIEMGMENIDYLVEKLSRFDYYPALFEKAYGSKDITKDKISDAMSQFLASITTADSKFDKVLVEAETFTELESYGQSVFFGVKAKCSGCHAGPNFSAPDGPFGEYGGGGGFDPSNDLKGTANIGLDARSSDKGLREGKFRIPSLRNIALTAPYMHDGRFATLEEVIDHYSEGIKENSSLDNKFRDSKGRASGLDLNEIEKRGLIAFLNTLTDYKFINDPKYSDPFVD